MTGLMSMFLMSMCLTKTDLEITVGTRLIGKMAVLKLLPVLHLKMT
jgi:hypothetical protein